MKEIIIKALEFKDLSEGQKQDTIQEIKSWEQNILPGFTRQDSEYIIECNKYYYTNSGEVIKYVEDEQGNIYLKNHYNNQLIPITIKDITI